MLLGSSPAEAERRAKVLMATGRVAEAAEVLEQALQGGGAVEWRLWSSLAVATQMLGRYDRAIVAYRKAIAIIPRQRNTHEVLAVLHYNLGGALDSAGRRDESIAAYRESIRLDPSPEAWINLGNVLLETGRADEAHRAYGNAPDDPRAEIGRAAALQVMTDLAGAVAAARRAVALAPELGDAYRQLAVALLAGEDGAGALAAAERAVELGSVRADEVRGAALLAVGRLDEAAEIFEAQGSW